MNWFDYLVPIVITLMCIAIIWAMILVVGQYLSDDYKPSPEELCNQIGGTPLYSNELIGKTYSFIFKGCYKE